LLMLAAEEERRHDGRRHHLRIAHATLRVFPVIQRYQQIGAQAIDEYNLHILASSPYTVVASTTTTVSENSWIF
jgi:hypothetical protein